MARVSRSRDVLRWEQVRERGSAKLQNGHTVDRRLASQSSTLPRVHRTEAPGAVDVASSDYVGVCLGAKTRVFVHVHRRRGGVCQVSGVARTCDQVFEPDDHRFAARVHRQVAPDGVRRAATENYGRVAAVRDEHRKRVKRLLGHAARRT